MQAGAAIVMFVFAVAPLVCAVDFGFFRPNARQKPSPLWMAGFALPWIFLVGAAGTGARVLFPVGFLLGGAMSAAWLLKRARAR